MNKEGRGLLTPSQFNLLGEQAQLDLLDESFFDYNRFMLKEQVRGINDEYASLADGISQKIDILSTSTIPSVINGAFSAPNDLYRIVELTRSGRTIQVEEVKKTEFSYLNSSKLTQPSKSFPVYYKEGNTFHLSPTSIDDIELDYIRKPLSPVWGYTGGGSTAYTYSSSNSQDFELHPSDETKLIIKILALAGVVIKDPTVVQVATQKETSTFNKENS